MEARHILRLVRKWFWLLILASFIGGAAGLVVSLLQPKIYEADATLFVNLPNRGDSGSVFGAQQAAKAFMEFPQSSPVLNATLQDLGDNSLSLSQLASMVTVQNNLDTQFVVVIVRDSDPERAARLATEIAKQSVAQFRVSANDGSNTKDFVLQELVTLETQIKNLEVELASIQNQTGPDATSPNRINQLSTSLSDLRSLYNQLVNSYSNLSSTQVTLFQEAEIPQVPISPKPKLAIAIGILSGLVAIVGVIFFIEQNDDILRTPAKVSQATDLPTLITVGRLPAVAKQTPWLNGHHEADDDTVKLLTVGAEHAPWLREHDEVVGDADKSRKAVAKQAPTTVASPQAKNKKIDGFQLPEAFLTLGVLLKGECVQSNSSSSTMRSLLISSPEDGDGKTVIAAQIALGLARIGVNVVLIDANLRKPKVHSFFGLSNKVGLTSLLTSNAVVNSSLPVLDSVSTALQKTYEPNLAILLSGPAVDSPTEVLLSPGMTAILNQLSKKAIVVIDSPAVLTSSEPVILADKCDSVLLVVDARRTNAIKLNRSLELLAWVKKDILGVVLNWAGTQN